MMQDPRSSGENDAPEAARAAEASAMRAWALEVEASRRPRDGGAFVEMSPSAFSGAGPGGYYSGHTPLRVRIVSARGLRAADWSFSGGKSDPYVVCEIPGKPASKFQTAVIAKTLTPKWNHEQELAGYAVGDSIKFDVYDKDTGKRDDFLGTLTLTSAQFHPHGFDGELPLRDAGRGIKAFIRLQIIPGLDVIGASSGLPGGALSSASLPMGSLSGPSLPIGSTSGGSPPGGGGVWACPVCTLENPAHAMECEACGTSRPAGAHLAPPSPGPGPAPAQPSARSFPSASPSASPSSRPPAASRAASPSRAASRKPTGPAGPPLQVLIQSARGLRAADWGGKSDPYCCCEIVGKPQSKVQTQVIEKTLDPTWNYAGELVDYVPGDSLLFSVYDKDWGKTDDLLGKLTMASNQFSPGGFEGELPLSEAGRGIRAYLRIKIMPAAESSVGDGFQVHVGKDALPGRDAFQMLASDISECKKVCSECGFGAFVVCSGQAYFRSESPAECLRGMTDCREATTYIYNPADAGGQLTRTISKSSSTIGQQMMYNSATGTAGKSVPLKVTILSANGLRGADWGGKSDPYCVCQIMSKPQSKFQTPSIDRNLNPVWNHPGFLSDYAMGDVVEFAVYDKDWGSRDDLLGRAMLTSAQILPNGFEGRLPLTDAKSGATSAGITVRVEAFDGAVPSTPTSSLRSPGERGQPLRLTMIGARGLRAAEWALVGAKSEPYCVCEVAGKPHTAQRTPVVGRTLEPMWNHSAELQEYGSSDALTFTIYHQSGGRGDEVLGRATLTAQELASGYEGELVLTDVGRGGQAFLRVRVERPRFAAGQGEWGTSSASTGPAVAITLESARGLRHTSSYCVCEVPGKPYTRLQTPVKDRTANPAWNHTVFLQGYSPGDSLVFTIHDTAKRDEVIGRSILTSSQLNSGGFRGELPLSDAGRGAHAFLSLRVDLPPGQGQAPQPWMGGTQGMMGPAGGRGLRLNIMGARGLRNAFWFTYSDSYCVCQVPGKPYSKVQTVVVKNSLDPTWNHEADVMDYAPGESLEFTVWNRSPTGADEVLGRAIVSSAQFQFAGGFDGEVPLLDNGSQNGAYLRLRVAYSQQATAAAPTALMQWRQPNKEFARNLDCNFLATAASILAGVPVGLPSDSRPSPAPLGSPLKPGSPTQRPPRGRHQAQQGPQDRRGEQGAIVAGVLDSLGEAYRNAGNLEEALVQSKKALDLRVESFGDQHPDTAASYYSIGSALRLQDRLEEAWQCHTRALEIRLQANGERHADTAASYTCLGAILLQQGEVDSALDYYFRALEISRVTLGEQHPDTVACYNDVGAVFERKGDLGNALQHLLRALEVQRQLVGDRHPLVGDACNNVGAVLWQQGRFNEALEHHSRAMEIRLQVLGDRHPDTALSYGNVGVILERLGRYPEAMEHQQRALEIRLVALGQQHSETAASYVNLGVVLERMQQFEQAIEHYKKAHSIVQTSLGPRHAWTEQALQRIKRCERAWRSMVPSMTQL